MGFADDLTRATQGLVDTINGIKVQRAVTGAREELEAIKASEFKDDEKRSAIRNLGQNLALHLTENAGLSPQAAQGFAEQVAPKPQVVQSVDQGLFSEDPSVREQAAKYKRLAFEQELALLNKKTEASLAGFGIKSDAITPQLIAKFRQEAKTGQPGKLYESFTQAQKTQAALAEFAKNPNGYTDYGTLMGGLKSLQGDSSVVREAEITLGKNAASMLQKTQNYLQEAITGKSLQPSQREAITKSLGVLAEAGKQKYIKATRPIYNQAIAKKLPLDQIFDDPTAYGQLPDYMSPAAEAQPPAPQTQGAVAPTMQPQAPIAPVPATSLRSTVTRQPQSYYNPPPKPPAPSADLSPIENAYNELISKNPARAAAWGTYKPGQVPLKISPSLKQDAERLVQSRIDEKAAAAKQTAMEKRRKEEDEIRFKRALAKERAMKKK